MKSTWTFSNKVRQKVLFIVMLLSPYYVLANQEATNCSICGTWRLISVTNLDQITGQKTYPYGEHPQGNLNYLPDGHMAVIIVSSNRVMPKTMYATPEEAAQLYSDMTSYSGTYTIENNAIIHHVAVAWNPRWMNTEQTRYYKLNGNQLILTMYKQLENKKIRSTLIWEKQ
jgi:hypothetical protein